MTQPEPDPSAAIRANDGLEGAKLAAIVLMVVNHVGLALPEPWPTSGHLCGRPCLALFAFVLGARLASRPAGRSGRAAVRLLLWGAVAQVPYLLLVGGVALRLDVLFTLALGAGGVWLMQTGRAWALIPLGAVAALANPWLDGGGLGAAAVVASAALLQRDRPVMGVLAAAACVAASNLIAAPDRLLAAAAVFAGPAIWLAARRLPPPPRLPGWAFYAFYPAHLAVIWLVFGPLG
ncbi:MAG: hypothetical protein JSR45_16640 [Proteobacteria bacterium]|nr:hypothetical protein [Pseudomonadota bacterium]